MMGDTPAVHRVVDSGYAIPDLMEVIRRAIDDEYLAAEDNHPSGIEVRVYIQQRGNPRPRY